MIDEEFTSETAGAHCVGNKPNASTWEDLAKAENYLHSARTGAWMNIKRKESK